MPSREGWRNKLSKCPCGNRACFWKEALGRACRLGDIWNKAFSPRRKGCDAKLPGDQMGFLKIRSFLRVSIAAAKWGFIRGVPKEDHET